MRSRCLRIGLSAAVLGAVAALPASGATATWIDRGLHVVGGPVPSGGRVVVLVSAHDRSVWLEAVDAKSGGVKWKLPEAFSGITAGGARSALVRLEGVRVASGAIAWRGHAPVVVADAPTACPAPLGSDGFCLVAATSVSTAPQLMALAAATGAVEATVPGVQRLMSTTPGLYQTTGRPTAVIDVRVPGGTAWGQRLSALFGAGYDPDYGWNFDRVGTVEIGSVGRAPVGGNTVALDTGKTVGLSAASGKRLWVDPGVFECFGTDALPGPWLCRLTGTATATAAGKVTASPDATLSLEGFAPLTGAIRWRVRAGHDDVAATLRGDVVVADTHRLLVQSHGRTVLVDLRSGATTPAAPGQTFWCAHANFFAITPPLGVGAERVGVSLYRPCDARRRAVTSVPPTSVSAIARAAGMRIWASPSGLQGIRG